MRHGRAFPIQPILIGRQALAAPPPTVVTPLPAARVVAGRPRRRLPGEVIVLRPPALAAYQGRVSTPLIIGTADTSRPARPKILRLDATRGVVQPLGPYPPIPFVLRARPRPARRTASIMLRVNFAPIVAAANPPRTTWVIAAAPRRRQPPATQTIKMRGVVQPLGPYPARTSWVLAQRFARPRTTPVQRTRVPVDTTTPTVPPTPTIRFVRVAAVPQARRYRSPAARLEFPTATPTRPFLLRAAPPRRRPGRVVIAGRPPEQVPTLPRRVIIRLALSRPGRRLLRVLGIDAQRFAAPPPLFVGDSGVPGPLFGSGQVGGTGRGSVGGAGSSDTGGYGRGATGGFGQGDTGGTAR